MKVVTRNQMVEIDRLATERYGIPGMVLMENAGLQVVDAALTLLGAGGSAAVIICGAGNNGGDGFVAARHLSNSGFKVTCYLLGDIQKLKGDALTNYIILTRMGLSPINIANEEELELAAGVMSSSHLIIDALYGTGFTGTLEGISKRVVELINEVSVPVLAIDIPSGLDANNGMTSELAVQADWTVTMALPKLGLLQPSAAPYVGRLTVADISIPPALITDPDLKINLITENRVRFYLPPRQQATHKGDYGHVLVIGGCSDMMGAVIMCSQAAMKMGAGLVSAAVPEPIRFAAAAQIPQAMTIALPATARGQIAKAALDPLITALQEMKSAVMGPGMSRYDEGKDLIAGIIGNTPVPLIIDADALNMLQSQPEVLRSASAQLILTPHPGEMARLTGMDINYIQGHRVEAACNFASEYGVVLVLKGSRTIIAVPSGDVYINPSGNPGMACGGSGDVLAGMIAGLVAQGLPAEAAAWMGVYLHGCAGDIAADDLGEYSLNALDIVSAIPRVIKDWTV
ncbi:MAG: NAD(P)H-hydrate dehydratase [Methylocystaceae bacterium]